MPHHPALDGLRGVAIVLVMLSHAHVPWMDWAALGVDVFFVLSGYLITHSLLQEAWATGQIDFWRFYQRRLYRLMPALLLFLAVYCLMAPMFWPDEPDWYIDALVSALYLADYGIAFFDLPSSLLHMWSLSVEEHFYLVWPLALLCLVRRTQPGWLWWRMLGLCLLAWLWRLLWVMEEQVYYQIFFRFDTRVTGLLAGALLALLMLQRPAWFNAIRLRARHGLWLLLALPWVLSLEWGDMPMLAWAMTWAEMLALVLVLLAQDGQSRVRAWLSQPWLAGLGKLSYGVYLWHYPIYRVLRANWDWPWVVLMGTALSVLCAMLSWMTVERWGRRWRAAQQPPPVARHLA